LRWDYENRLAAIESAPGSAPPPNPSGKPYRNYLPLAPGQGCGMGSQPPIPENYNYDGDGNRVRKQNEQETVFYIGPHLEVRVTAGQTKTTKYYAFHGQRLVMRLPDGTLNYLHTDHLGSVVLATDGSGAVVGENRPRYDAFGNERAPSVSALPTELAFTGQRLDANGLMYYGARYYEPSLGTLISPDSIVARPGDPTSLNRYVYSNTDWATLLNIRIGPATGLRRPSMS
jgi:RHS repeat-associated protein